MRQGQLAIITALLVLFSACTKEHRTVIEAPVTSGPTGPATLSTMQEDIFRLGCAVSGCHDNRANPAAFISLTTADHTYSSIVDKLSTQAHNRKLVLPGNSADSYLVDKLRGTHLIIGGTGDRMPQYSAPLVEGDLDRIVAWIDAGAQKN